jgi:hypothetical protein
MPFVKRCRVRLRPRPLVRRDLRGTQPLPVEDRRVVEIDERRLVGELELRERERQPDETGRPAKRASCSTTAAVRLSETYRQP